MTKMATYDRLVGSQSIAEFASYIQEDASLAHAGAIRPTIRDYLRDVFGRDWTVTDLDELTLIVTEALKAGAH